MSTIILNYQVVSTLYETEFSLIYRVERLDSAGNSPKIGILKLLKSDYPTRSEIECIQKEFEFINLCDSNFVIHAYEIGFHNNQPFIFIEDFNAISIRDYLKRIELVIRVILLNLNVE